MDQEQMLYYLVREEESRQLSQVQTDDLLILRSLQPDVASLLRDHCHDHEMPWRYLTLYSVCLTCSPITIQHQRYKEGRKGCLEGW